MKGDMTKSGKTWLIHAVLAFFSLLTLLPFAFTVNNVFRSNTEFYHSFFSLPEAFTQGAAAAVTQPEGGSFRVRDEDGTELRLDRGAAVRFHLERAVQGPRRAWKVIRPYMLNTLVVTALTVMGVLLLGSATAYILSRYRFAGHKALFLFIISTMMFPGVLTLVPSFLLVK